MQTRRELLAAAGTLAAGTLAGCSTLRSNGGGYGTASGGKTVNSLPTPVRGDPNADVTVMVFEDYACPHCAHYSKEIAPKVFENYTKPGKIRYEHHDFPIPVSPKWSWGAANAARAVQDAQGDKAFFSYTETLFSNQSNYVNAGKSGYSYLGSTAANVGADSNTVVKAAKTERYDPILHADKKKGKNLGLRGTPTVYVNGSATKNFAYDTISSAIDAARSG